MRAVWSGNLTFVLINIPVKLYKAAEDHRVHLRNLCASCNNPINLRRWCSKCEKDVPLEGLNKGFKLEKEKYAVFTAQELDAVEPEESKTIKIEKFVDASQLIPISYDSFYFLAPDKGAEHAYSLLQKALSIQNKAIIGRFVMRNKEHVCAIQAYQQGLLLITMHYAEEINNINELVRELEKPGEEELRLAMELIEKLGGKFSLEEYRDTYKEKIMRLVEQKEKGEKIVVEVRPVPKAPKDLMRELRKSIEVLSK